MPRARAARRAEAGACRAEPGPRASNEANVFAMRTTLAARGSRGISLVDLSLVRLRSGEVEALANGGESCAVVLSGAVDVRPLGRAAREGNVFESLGDAVYAPPASTLELSALGDAVVAVATAPV